MGFHVARWCGILERISVCFGVLWAQNGRTSNSGKLILVNLLITNPGSEQTQQDQENPPEQTGDAAG